MEAKRWTLGVVLAAAVSLFGLIQADASPFSSYVLSDDLGNSVKGSAPQASDWDDGAGTDDGSGSDSADGSGGGDDTGGGADTGGGSGDEADGKDNNGHGNNLDGVDSSNKGNSKEGEDTSCPEEGGECIDDEAKTNSGKKK
jgi:hypothetical protein